MFTLVVFTLVVGRTISGSFMRVGRHRGVRRRLRRPRRSAPASPIDDPAQAIANAPGLNPASYASSPRSRSSRWRRGRRADGPGIRELPGARPRRRIPANHTTYGLAAHARGYRRTSGARSQRSPASRSSTRLVAPRRDNWGAGRSRRTSSSRGSTSRTADFAPVPVDVRDPQTGRTMRLTVIGVLGDRVRRDAGHLDVAGDAHARPSAARARPTVYCFDLAEGVDPRAVAQTLESAFLANGLEAEALEETLEDAVKASWTFNCMIEGFMGLGLVVGVAALGVISARAVVERRQQIGVLRSIGFRRRMIQIGVPARVVVRRADGDRRRDGARADRRLQRDLGRLESADLGHAHLPRPVGEPGFVFSSSTSSLLPRLWRRPSAPRASTRPRRCATSESMRGGRARASGVSTTAPGIRPSRRRTSTSSRVRAGGPPSQSAPAGDGEEFFALIERPADRNAEKAAVVRGSPRSVSPLNARASFPGCPPGSRAQVWGRGHAGRDLGASTGAGGASRRARPPLRRDRVRLGRDRCPRPAVGRRARARARRGPVRARDATSAS